MTSFTYQDLYRAQMLAKLGLTESDLSNMDMQTLVVQLQDTGGGTGGTVPEATDTVSGTTTYASNTETTTGAISNKSVTPAGVKAATDTLFNLIVGAPPANLNSLAELAASIGNDPAFASSVASALALKVDKTTTVAGVALSGNVTAANIADALRDATTAVKGLVALTSNSDVISGVDTTKAATAAAITAMLGARNTPIIIKASNSTTFPSRASKVPSGYAGPVIFDMTDFPSVTATAAATAADTAGATNGDYLDVIGAS